MPKQPAFPGLRYAMKNYAMKNKVTRGERFRTEMDAVMPWCRLLASNEPY